MLLTGAALIAVSASGVYAGARAQELPQDQPVAVTAPAANPEAGVPAPAPAPETGVPAEPSPPAAPGDTAMESASGTYEEMDPISFTKLNESMASMAVLRKDIVKPQEIGTLVFTLWQHALLQDAKRLFTTRRPTASDIAAAADGSAVQAKPRGVRELGLNGILYKSKDNWIVWLNGKRMAPDALPREIIDIKVEKDYVDLKWFDVYSNLIYPVRIRPHQRFNLDSRIFLPGLTADAAAQLQAASTGQ